MAMKPFTKKELKECFEVYRNAFPEWEADVPYSLTRTCGPITQVIGFQSLSYGAYRPMCGIEVSGPPSGSTLLPQMLDVKHREVRRLEHAEKWPRVLKAIEQEFVPDVRQPLDIADVLRLAEEEIGQDDANGKYLNGLATLNVHLGRDDRAIGWCNRVEARLKEFPESTPLSDGMKTDIDFACKLREALQSGRGKEFLDAASD